MKYLDLDVRVRARGRLRHKDGRSAVALTLLSVSAALLSPVAARAQTQTDTQRISIVEARARALKFNPARASALAAVGIARGDLRQARVFRFNPVLEALPAASGGIGPEASAAQEIEVAGQRRARVRSATAGVSAANAAAVDTERGVIGDTDRAFYRLSAMSRRYELAREIVQLNENLADVASRQLKDGEISRLDYNLASVELGRSQSRALQALSDREQAEAELKRMLGSITQSRIVPAVDTGHDVLLGTTATERHLLSITARTSAVDTLTAIALARRPDLIAQTALVSQAAAQVSTARRDAFPNVVIRAVTERGESGNAVMRPGLGLSLPIFNRNQGAIEAARAAETRAAYERSAVVLQVRTDVEHAFAGYRSAHQRVQILESTVLPQSRENRRLLQIAYREGKVGLPVLLLIRNQVLDAELEFWDAWLSEREAFATLSEATASTTEMQQ